MSEATIENSDSDRGGCDDQELVLIVLSYCPDPLSFHAGVSGELFDLYNRALGQEFETAQETVDKILAQDSPTRFENNSTAKSDTLSHCYGDDFDAICEDISTVLSDDNVDVTEVLIPTLASLGIKHREIAANLEALQSVLPDGTPVHVFGEDRWTFTLGSEAFDTTITVLRKSGKAGVKLHRRISKRDIDRWAGLEYNGGRPPLGFKAVDGELVPDYPFYDRVCDALTSVVRGELSKRRCAALLDTSPRTVTRAIEDRGELYGLSPQ